MSSTTSDLKRSQDDAALTDAEKLEKLQHQFAELERRANAEKLSLIQLADEEKARAEREKTRADEEKTRADEEKARADKEKTQREATAWLDKIHAGSVKFASDVARATPHQTPRNSSSHVSTGSLPLPAPPRDDVEAVVLAESITTALQSDSFWTEASTVSSSEIDHVCAAIKNNPKIKVAFDNVISARNERRKAAEVALVHPFAHELFNTIHKAAPLPNLHLYLEREMPIDGALSRRPDQLFYIHKGPPPESLNMCLQRNGVLSVELESVLDNEHEKLAMVELLRDFAFTVGEGAEREKRDFFGLMGDGVDWIATRWRTVFSQGSTEKPFAVRVSQRFTLDLDNDESVRVFVSRVLAVRAAAARQSRHLTGWDVPRFNVVEPCKVLAVTGSCVVAECRTNNGQSFALKIRSPIDSTRCEQDASTRVSLGLDTLRPSIARCSAVDFFGVRPVLQLDVVGTVLEDMCLCDHVARLQLARVVYDDVRVGLQWLHERNLAFVDLHPGNIVISSTGRAFLIDLESSSTLGEPTTKPIRAAFRTLAADNTPTRDTDSRGLLLVLAWILDIQGIRSAVARVDSRDAGADKAAALLSTLGTLDEFVRAHLP